MRPSTRTYTNIHTLQGMSAGPKKSRAKKDKAPAEPAETGAEGVGMGMSSHVSLDGDSLSMGTPGMGTGGMGTGGGD